MKVLKCFVFMRVLNALLGDLQREWSSLRKRLTKRNATKLQAGTPYWAAYDNGRVSLIPASEMEAHWALTHGGQPLPDPVALDLLRQALMFLPGDSNLLQEVGNYLRKFPPCADCGAMTEREAERTCRASSADDGCHGCELWQDDEPQSTAAASNPPGCPRELPTADEVRAWLDEDPEVEDPAFLVDPDTPNYQLRAYPVTAVPAIILAALRRWGCDPQFSAEEVAMHAAPWSLLEPLPRPDFRALCAKLLQGLDENRHEQVRYPGHLRLVMADARAALGQSSPTPTRDELNDASGPGPTVEPAFTPIPVSERLPGPEDCAPWPGEPEEDPWCWCAKYIGGGWEWLQIPALLDDYESAIFRFRANGCTHWAPWWALPIPTTQEDSDNV